MANEIVRQEQDGIEFFTVVETGESGMSVSGLARLAGRTQQSASYLLNQLTSGKQVKGLESLTGVEFQLTTGKTKHNRKIIRDDVCAILLEYWAFDAPGKTETALFSFRKFARIGIRTWIQEITGWTPEKKAAIAYLTDVVQRDPLPWERHFSAEWVRNAERLTGYKWEWRVMGKFINRAVYNYMPAEVRTFLDEVNPIDKDGIRPNKQHQHFKEDAGEVLKSHIRTVNDLMQASISEQQFDELMAARFRGVYQFALSLDQQAS